MGMIFYKQERYQRAEVYYRKALSIHPNNSVLLCHLGVVQHALNRTDKALDTFAKALSNNPNDPLCKFHRASVLFAVNRLDDALLELEELKQIVPKESLVYFLIAKVYSKKGDTHKALLHFSWATDLDPKGANNQIKESIEPVLSRSITSMSSTLELNGNGGEQRQLSDASGEIEEEGVEETAEYVMDVSTTSDSELTL
jgi:anaphase-promoting complex subunit 3